MNFPSSHRKVKLIDLRSPGRPLIEADLYRDYPAAMLDHIEAEWAQARMQAATAGSEQGLTLPEHADWDWRTKAESVEAGRHMLIAIEFQGVPQGVMAVSRAPQRARVGAGHVVYVDYLETAPWNLKGFVDAPRFAGVGTVLIAEAVRLSREMTLDGRVGLHALAQAEAFYATRCLMTRVGPDPAYFDLTYFEFTGQQASDWLVRMGDVP